MKSKPLRNSLSRRKMQIYTHHQHVIDTVTQVAVIFCTLLFLIGTILLVKILNISNAFIATLLFIALSMFIVSVVYLVYLLLHRPTITN